MEYDALLIAVGARQVEAYEHVATFRDADADATYQGIVQDIEEGYSRSLAFIQPVGPVWPLPLYELALMTAERAESMDIRDLELVLVTPEPRPLAVFGTAVSDVVSNRLEQAGITVYCNSLAKVPATGRLLIEPQGVELHAGADHHDAACRGPVDSRPARAQEPRVHSDRQALLGARHGRPRVRRRRRCQLSDQARRSRRADGRCGGCGDSRARRVADQGARVQPGHPWQAPDRVGSRLYERPPCRAPRASSRRSSTSRPGPRTRRSSQRSSGRTSRRSTRTRPLPEFASASAPD